MHVCNNYIRAVLGQIEGSSRLYQPLDIISGWDMSAMTTYFISDMKILVSGKEVHAIAIFAQLPVPIEWHAVTALTIYGITKYHYAMLVNLQTRLSS